MLSYLFTFCLCLRQNAFHCFSLVFMSSQFRTRYHKLFMALVVLASPLLDHRLTISLTNPPMLGCRFIPVLFTPLPNTATLMDIRVSRAFAGTLAALNNSVRWKNIFSSRHMEICTKNLPVVGIRFLKRLIRV